MCILGVDFFGGVVKTNELGQPFNSNSGAASPKSFPLLLEI